MRGRPITNHELAALITASGRPHAALARKVNAAAAALHGLDLRYDQASVYWWLRGRVPEEPIPGLLAAVFTEWLASPVQVPDLGFTDPGGHLGLTLPSGAAEAVASVSELWRYVLRRRMILGAGFAIGASVGAGFDWHFGVLLVKPYYREHWTLPGGMLDDGETPQIACAREISEELGVIVPIGRLLVIDWAPAQARRPRPIIYFLFDAGVLGRETEIRLQDAELDEHGFIDPDQVVTRVASYTAARVSAALSARASGATIYLPQNGTL